MMGNFFRVTCPFLFQLDTVAMFPLLRGNHSYEAVARIQETTQLFLDIYSMKKIFIYTRSKYGTGILRRCSCPTGRIGRPESSGH